ncbi:unnamed protein product [Adineta steineri]|uniref:26S proteasome regulatory subunit Rpn7 N-terminal domain-containing protein n=1 Tax=Adineta steineri TaxID=433720 RepID=A0A813MKF4_9BILA|nr:unnamed protein product [Adineta steineri]CAF3930958.1 unnamed protein product [Adineta steineri]
MNVKVYQDLHVMSIRDFKSAAELFLDIVAILTLYELIDYQTFILLSKDRYLVLHAELLQSYSSLTFKGMAQAFGSSEIFLDKELSRFIARGN